MAFVHDPKQSNDTVTAFTYVPDTESDYYKAHVTAMDVLNRLVSLIPKGTHDFDDSNSADYPFISSKLMEGSQVYYHIRRPVFSIAGVPFFRRYNDDYNSSVIYGHRSENRANYVSWNTDIGSDALNRLAQLIDENDINDITETMVRDALRRS
jgi:hypothetical protein